MNAIYLAQMIFAAGSAASSNVELDCALAISASLNQFEKDKVAYKVLEPTQPYIRKNFKAVACNAEGPLVGVLFSSSTSETSRDGSIYYRVNVEKNTVVEKALFLP